MPSTHIGQGIPLNCVDKPFCFPIRALRFTDGIDTSPLDRLSLVLGGALVVLDAKVEAVGGIIDAAYGWDPSPGDDAASVAVAGRALTVKFNVPDAVGVSLDPFLTFIAVPAMSP